MLSRISWRSLSRSARPPLMAVMSRSASLIASGAVGEGLHHLERAVVADDHHLHRRAQVVHHELPDPAQDPIAVEWIEVLVVDVKHRVDRPDLPLANGLRRRRSRRRGLGASAGEHVLDDLLVELGEVRDRHLETVLNDAEIGGPQALDRPPRAVADKHVDV